MRESHTYIAVPPGETIKEMFAEQGLTQKSFALKMGLSESCANRLICGDDFLTKDIAKKLELVLGVPEGFWSSLEQLYRKKLKLVDEENALENDKLLLNNISCCPLATVS